VGGPAIALAAVDLVVKAKVPTAWWAFHHRSHAWVVLSLVLLAAVAALVLVPSRWVALAAGVMSGGVIGNLVSAHTDRNWVPNPLTIGSYRGGIAFNLADVFFLTGNLLLMAALIVVTLRNRDRLLPPRAWQRALRRRLGS
jgi:lipoprotein signal peptidase